MTMTKLVRSAVVIAVMVGLAGCASGTPEALEPESTVSVEPTAEPVAEPAPEPTVEVPQFPTEVGAIIPADQVEAARAAGIPVYVSPNGGDGVVVQPAQPLPPQVINDFNAAYGGPLPQNTMEWRAKLSANSKVTDALVETGVPFIRIQWWGSYDDAGLIETKYTGSVGNTPGFYEFNRSLTPSDTKEGMLAQLQSVIDANPGIPIIDMAY